MKMALAVCSGNVCCALRQATGFLVADLDPRHEGVAFEVPVRGRSATLMAEHLSRLDVQVVLSGDLSATMVAALEAYGIRVVCGRRGKAAAEVYANRAQRASGRKPLSRNPLPRRPSPKEPRGWLDYQSCCDPGVGVRAHPVSTKPELTRER